MNVALLQNNTLGPQTGGGMGNQYVHQHRLVHLITGQWGDDVSPTTTGTLIDENYTYTVPANYNGVPVPLEDLEIVVFMTETQQEIISGNGAKPTFTNLPFNNDVLVASDVELDDQCGQDYGPTVTIQNRGNNTLTSVAIDYSINGDATETYNWTGSLSEYETEEIVLDPIPYTLQSNNTVDISIPNDEDNSNNSATNTFGEITNEYTSLLNLYMALDDDGDEVTWNILNSNGDVVQSGGPYASGETVNVDFSIPEMDCFRFILTDSGDNGQYFIRLRDANNDIIFRNETNSNFGSTFVGNFRLDGVLGVSDNNLQGVSIFPNPATNVLNVQNAENATVQVFDILGKKLIELANISSSQEVNVTSLQAGTYFVKITNGASVQTEKFVINR
ncbi:MAG: hypothetical protein CMC13_10730 [Flavobacteriaceae bacterium]|nr:hypothetical protein [Flavobacteriaceae bacterium]